MRPRLTGEQGEGHFTRRIASGSALARKHRCGGGKERAERLTRRRAGKCRPTERFAVGRKTPSAADGRMNALMGVSRRSPWDGRSEGVKRKMHGDIDSYIGTKLNI